MPIEMTCTGCRQTLRVADEHAGKKARCPACGTIAEVPRVGGETQPVAEPSNPFSPASQPASVGNPFSDRPEAIANPYASPSAPTFGPQSFGRPHRGGMVLAFGIIGILCCGAVGTPFGIAAWVIGASDLSEIRAGRMDPSGESLTRVGMILGIVSVSIAVLGVLFGVGMLAVGAVH